MEKTTLDNQATWISTEPFTYDEVVLDKTLALDALKYGSWVFRVSTWGKF
jgi:hypothetical protein